MSTPTSYINKQTYIPPMIRVRELVYSNPLAESGTVEESGGESGDEEGGNGDRGTKPSSSTSKDFYQLWDSEYEYEF